MEPGLVYLRAVLYLFAQKLIIDFVSMQLNGYVVMHNVVHQTIGEVDSTRPKEPTTGSGIFTGR